MGMLFPTACLACLAFCFVGRSVSRKKTLLPPGPTGWPLIGNLFDFPVCAPHKTLGTMSEKYGKSTILAVYKAHSWLIIHILGPMLSLKVMGTQYVILNSFKTTKDLLEKKSAVTSNRPAFTMASELVGWGDSTGFLQYGDAYRKHRKFFHQQIGSKSSLEAFYPAEEAEAKQFIHNVLKTPDDLSAHARRMAGSVILKISHGYSVKENGDPLVEMANRAMRNISVVTSPGRFLVDLLPMLRHLPDWFPGCRFLKDAKRWRKMVSEAVNTPHQFVLECLEKGDAVPSFTSRLLQEGVTPEDEELLKWASFSMYLGGSDTTPAALSAFFLAMTMYPDIFKKAQAEVDAAVGHGRLPSMQDRERLPYVNAICKEILRWNVIVPMAMHVTTQDEIYSGYLIPKGSCLLGNIWFILSDPKTYPEPDLFDPERFLGNNQQPDPRDACFGWGRRLCPGAQLADISIFISVVMALATLNVSRCVENGVSCIPTYEVEEGTVRFLKPFKCRIAPRSEKAEEPLNTSCELN